MSNPTKPKLTIVNGKPTCTSLDVAAHFGKSHFHVLRDIETILSASKIGCANDPQSGPAESEVEAFSQRNFALGEYLDKQKKPRLMYRLTEPGFALIAMGFTGPKALMWKIRYISAFEEMRERLQQSSEGAKLVRRIERQLSLLPEVSATLTGLRPTVTTAAAAIMIESARVMCPSPSAEHIVRLIKKNALEGVKDDAGRWHVYADSLNEWLSRRKFNAA
jgi:Rha family phage regulatory protein